MISSRSSNRGHVWTLLLFAVVMLLMLVAIVFGVRVYDAATRANAATTQLRAVEGYLSSALKAADENNAVSVAAGPQGDVLRIATGDGNATSIYLSDGNLVEEYGAASNALDPQSAVPIAKLESFSADISESRVIVTTDVGTVVASLRSAGDAQ